MPKISQEDKFRKRLERAISLAGSQRELGRAIKVHPQTISLALAEGKGLKGVYALRIERLTCGAVKRHEIDPLTYPPSEYQFLTDMYKLRSVMERLDEQEAEADRLDNSS